MMGSEKKHEFQQKIVKCQQIYGQDLKIIAMKIIITKGNNTTNTCSGNTGGNSRNRNDQCNNHQYQTGMKSHLQQRQ